MLSEASRAIAESRFAALGLKLQFGAGVAEEEIFGSASVATRVTDLHAAFADPSVNGIFTVIGGFNSNQLLRFMDWGLIRANPKVFCGYSDITALGNAMLAKSGLVTYSGPHYSSFGEKYGFEYSLEHAIKCFFEEGPCEVGPSAQWSDDHWFVDQEQRQFMANPGWDAIHAGEATGTIVGGNLCTLNLLQGTDYFPDLQDTIVFVEDDYMVDGRTFDRDLQSLLHQPGFGGVKGLVIGRFQKASGVDADMLRHIVNSKRELANVPVIANADFGHSTPRFTFPIGGRARMVARPGACRLTFEVH